MAEGIKSAGGPSQEVRNWVDPAHMGIAPWEGLRIDPSAIPGLADNQYNDEMRAAIAAMRDQPLIEESITANQLNQAARRGNVAARTGGSPIAAADAMARLGRGQAAIGQRGGQRLIAESIAKQRQYQAMIDEQNRQHMVSQLRKQALDRTIRDFNLGLRQQEAAQAVQDTAAALQIGAQVAGKYRGNSSAPKSKPVPYTDFGSNAPQTQAYA